VPEEKYFDVKEHELVPEHEVLSEEEAEEVLERYDISRSQLPKIKEKDPVAEAMDLESGDVVEVTRESPTAGEKTAYRLVI